MIQILVTGHGSFATGMLSSVQLIAGEQDFVQGVDFEESDSTDVLKKKLEQLISTKEEILILADLKGGSPYNVSVMLKEEYQDRKIEVLSGTNLTMILSAIFLEKTTLNEMVKVVLCDGAEGICRFEKVEQVQEYECEDGI